MITVDGEVCDLAYQADVWSAVLNFSRGGTNIYAVNAAKSVDTAFPCLSPGVIGLVELGVVVESGFEQFGQVVACDSGKASSRIETKLICVDEVEITSQKTQCFIRGCAVDDVGEEGLPTW